MYHNIKRKTRVLLRYLKHFFRIWSKTRCQRCQCGISKTDLVMQAHSCYYHVNCFGCFTCGVQLRKGQRFGVKDQKVYCESHYKQMIDLAASPNQQMNDRNNNIGLHTKIGK